MAPSRFYGPEPGVDTWKARTGPGPLRDNARHIYETSGNIELVERG